MQPEDRELLEAVKARLRCLPFRKWRRNLCCFVLCCIACEGLILLAGWDLYAVITKYVPELLLNVLGMLSVLASIVSGFKQEKISPRAPPQTAADDKRTSAGQGHSHTAPAGHKQTMGDRAGTFLARVLFRLWRSGPVSLAAVLMIWIFIPSCVAHYYMPCAHLVVRSFYVCEQAVLEQPPVAAESGAPALPAQSDPPPKIEVTAPPEGSPGFLQDPDALWELTGEDYDRIYFQTPEYLVTDWTDQEEVTRTVARLVGDLRAVSAPNLFDAQAPEDLKTEVAQADTDYRQMTHSCQLDQTIDIHLRAWEYPKYSIASLLANEYQKYALEYHWAGGPFQTMEYYYGQSILWAQQAITFASATDYQVKFFLYYISYRYHDIADAAPDHSAIQRKASMLCQAYSDVRNLEF